LKLGRLLNPKRRASTTTAHTILVTAVHAPGRQHHEIVIDSTMVAVFCVEKWSLVFVLWSTTGVRNCGVRGETDGGSGTHHRRTPHSVQWPSPIFFTWRGEGGIRLVGSAKGVEQWPTNLRGGVDQLVAVYEGRPGPTRRRGHRRHRTAATNQVVDGGRVNGHPRPRCGGRCRQVRASSGKKAPAPAKSAKKATRKPTGRETLLPARAGLPLAPTP
jgi:hypothetical protein